MKHRMKCLLSLSLLTGICCVPVSAQTFPEKENGATVYYRIVNASPDYAARQLCLQDVSTSKGTYNYVLREYDADSKQQDWTFAVVSAAGETYNLRNRQSYRYVSTAGTWVEDFLTQNYTTRKVATDALAFTPLGDNQYAISYESDGQTRYLAATDVSAAPKAMPKQKKDSPWAWHIYKAVDMQTGVLEALVPTEQVRVADRRITVEGAAQWWLYDMQGREYPAEQTLAPGMYLVKTARMTKKVIIKP